MYQTVAPGSDLSLFQHGLGDYENVGDWTWELYPFAYDFLAPADSTPQPAPVIRGLGCGCGCGGGCQEGLGQTSTTGGLFGTGLFSSSDPANWGWGEWLALGLGGWAFLSAVGDVKRAGRATGRAYRAARSTR